MYTKLSTKSIQRICGRQWRINKNRTNMKHKQLKQQAKPTKCPQIDGITVEKTWKRLFGVGSASKCGDNWLITEYSNGYSLFEYHNKHHPTSIYTLPEQFEGTDHTAYRDSSGNKHFIYFSSNVGWKSGSIVKVDLRTQKHIRTVLVASNVIHWHIARSLFRLPCTTALQTSIWKWMVIGCGLCIDCRRRRSWPLQSFHWAIWNKLKAGFWTTHVWSTQPTHSFHAPLSIPPALIMENNEFKRFMISNRICICQLTRKLNGNRLVAPFKTFIIIHSVIPWTFLTMAQFTTWNFIAIKLCIDCVQIKTVGWCVVYRC